MTCFDLPCGAVLRAQQVSWNKPERGKCRPPHHLRPTFNASYLPDLTKTAALRALKARHIKTRTSLVSLPLTFKELQRPNVSSCGLCFSHISEPGTHLKMLRVGGGRTGITLSECQHVDYCVLKTRIIHSFGHGYAVFWCNRSHRAPNWLWQPLQMCISQCLLAFFYPISHDRRCQHCASPESESRLSGPLGMIIIAAIWDHWATHTKGGINKTMDEKWTCIKPAADSIDFYWIYSGMHELLVIGDYTDATIVPVVSFPIASFNV